MTRKRKGKRKPQTTSGGTCWCKKCNNGRGARVRATVHWNGDTGIMKCPRGHEIARRWRDKGGKLKAKWA